MKTPNPEQKLAIEHEGGVILKAGAGSGKTFVLVEHIVYLIQKFLDQNPDKAGEDFSRLLSSYFSKIVLMTFTKKSAGELETRVRIKVSQLAEKDNRWQQARDQLGHLNISTIHGFCHKLLTQGYITDLNPDIDILSDIEYKSKVDNLIDDWLLTKNLTPEFNDIFFGHKKVIAGSFQSVFGSPELRSMWAGAESEKAPELSIEDFFKEIFKLLQLGESEELDFESFFEFASKKWYQNLKGYYDLDKSYPLNSVESFERHIDYFASIKSLTKPHEYFADFHSKAKKLKAFFKDQKENILAYYKKDRSFYNDWYVLLKELFDYIDRSMPYFHGLNYADLEYYTLKGLSNPEIAKKIRSNYHYFIVDEFQDTSPGQFSILTKLVGGDFNNLFCVGDLKQAIYGFRGGEIGVFKECEKVVPGKLSLAFNYRSGKKIIDFCNEFFQLVFTLDAKLAGHVPAPFEIDSQIYPGDLNSGEIVKTKVVVDDTNLGRDAKRRDFEIIEAISILNRIEEIQGKHSGEEICILYRALAPSKYLIHYLLKNKVAFLAQVKIPQGEDPVLGIFKVLIESCLNENDKTSYAYFEILIKSYLGYLKLPVPGNLEKLLNTFKGDLNIIGALEAFRKFFFSLGLSNSNHKENMALLASMVNIGDENLELIWDQLNQGRSSTYSFEFQLGRGGGNLKIMTVHASKGLEFDHVILGGIHVRSKPPGNNPIMGKGPYALLWKEKAGQSKFYVSPGYLLEKQTENLKEASESKRLLYVACTRPKKSLSWMDITIDGKKVKYGSDPWILAFRKMEDNHTTKTFDLKYSGEHFENPTPFFHKGPQGMAPKIDHLADVHKLATVSELSVTRLAHLVDCPRKFYLQNICRLEDGDLNIYFEEQEEEVDIKSSSKRGTRIHATLSDILEGRETQNILKEDQKAIDFASKSLSGFDRSQLISEKEIKFPLFGYMCSGIPDLMVAGESIFKIIDFKTGAYHAKGSAPYWFQLSCYAYAAYYLKLLDKSQDIELSLYYLDEEKILTQTLTFETLKENLFSTWEKLNDLAQVNIDHCPTCKFRNMCYQTVAGRPSYDKINPEI